MIEKFLAALLLLVCAVMLARLCVGLQRRRLFDALARQAWALARGRALYVWHWRTSRKRAELAAEEAIRRARLKREREGNIVRPEAFREPRKPH